MTLERVVIDASVIVALLITPGRTGELIARRLAAAQLHAPAHLPVAVTNVLRRQRTVGALSDAEAALALRGLWSLAMELWPQEVLSARTWELGSNLSSYDAAYVALAEQLDAPLITADARLSRAPRPTCAIEVFA